MSGWESDAESTTVDEATDPAPRAWSWDSVLDALGEHWIELFAQTKGDPGFFLSWLLLSCPATSHSSRHIPLAA
jgi:hypothetical protein